MRFLNLRFFDKYIYNLFTFYCLYVARLRARLQSRGDRAAAARENSVHKSPRIRVRSQLFIVNVYAVVVGDGCGWLMDVTCDVITAYSL